MTLKKSLYGKLIKIGGYSCSDKYFFSFVLAAFGFWWLFFLAEPTVVETGTHVGFATGWILGLYKSRLRSHMHSEIRRPKTAFSTGTVCHAEHVDSFLLFLDRHLSFLYSRRRMAARRFTVEVERSCRSTSLSRPRICLHFYSCHSHNPFKKHNIGRLTVGSFLWNERNHLRCILRTMHSLKSAWRLQRLDCREHDQVWFHDTKWHAMKRKNIRSKTCLQHCLSRPFSTKRKNKSEWLQDAPLL